MVGRVKDHLGVTRVLNWVPSLPARGRLLGVPSPAVPSYPPFMSLLAKMQPIRDQGDLGACTAFSAEAPLWTAQVNAKRLTLVNPSPLFIYYNERLMNGQVGSDAGASISDIFRATNKYGICDENIWPYDPSQFTTVPPAAVYSAAAAQRAHIYAPVPQLKENIIGCLHRDGCPLDFGIMVYSSFMSNAVAATGKVPMPASSDKAEGGHAIDIIGYNDQSTENLGIPPLSFVFRNSWSILWGANGYGFLPYDYVLNGEYASDFWMIRLI